jgi:hypothetical protein
MKQAQASWRFADRNQSGKKAEGLRKQSTAAQHTKKVKNLQYKGDNVGTRQATPNATVCILIL